MRCEWKRVKLKDCCYFKEGYVNPPQTYPEYFDGDIKWIRAVDLNDSYVYTTSRTLSQIGFESAKKSAYLFPPDSIVISKSGTIGRLGIIKDYMCGNRATINIQPKENINLFYLFYFLRSKQREFANLAVGSVQKNLYISILEEIEIDLPSLQDQKRIAVILSSLDDKIELNNKINENLERQAQSIYHELFETINKDELPVGWRVVTLGDVAVISKKSFNPSKEPEIMLEHYSIPAFDESHFPAFELSTTIKSNKFVIDNECFMISKLNPTTKRVWMPYCLTENAVCSTEFIVYKAKDGTITNFLYSVIDSVSFSDFMCSHVTGSTGSRQRTTPSDTLSFEFVLPSEDELNRFQTLVSPMYTQMKINAIENDKLKRLRDCLLPKLMSGELSPEEGD